jgi:hypothetical protein
MMPIEPCSFRDRQGRTRCTECGVSVDVCVCDRNEKAEARWDSPEERFLRAVIQRLQEDRINHLSQRHMCNRLGVQLGQLVSFLLLHDDQGPVSEAEVYQKCIELCSTTIRLALEGDSTLAYNSKNILS